jgi:hypothetical protein
MMRLSQSRCFSGAGLDDVADLFDCPVAWLLGAEVVDDEEFGVVVEEVLDEVGAVAAGHPCACSGEEVAHDDEPGVPFAVPFRDALDGDSVGEGGLAGPDGPPDDDVGMEGSVVVVVGVGVGQGLPCVLVGVVGYWRVGPALGGGDCVAVVFVDGELVERQWSMAEVGGEDVHVALDVFGFHAVVVGEAVAAVRLARLALARLAAHADVSRGRRGRHGSACSVRER